MSSFRKRGGEGEELTVSVYEERRFRVSERSCDIIFILENSIYSAGTEDVSLSTGWEKVHPAYRQT